MATKAGSQSGARAAEDTADRIRELNERIIERAREAGETYLDAYERALETIAQYNQQLASASPVEWVQRVIDAQATFMREIGNLYSSTAREFLKK
jgi:hypothetical protein